MKIQVTAEHIALAKELDLRSSDAPRSMRCPIALAIREQTCASTYGVVVGPETVSVELLTKVPLPIEARNFITKFDKDEEVRPFSFDLPIEARQR